MLVERANSSLVKTGINHTPARVRQERVPRLQGDFLGTQMPPATRCPQRDPELLQRSLGRGAARGPGSGNGSGRLSSRADRLLSNGKQEMTHGTTAFRNQSQV